MSFLNAKKSLNLLQQSSVYFTRSRVHNYQNPFQHHSYPSSRKHPQNTASREIQTKAWHRWHQTNDNEHHLDANKNLNFFEAFIATTPFDPPLPQDKPHCTSSSDAEKGNQLVIDTNDSTQQPLASRFNFTPGSAHIVHPDNSTIITGHVKQSIRYDRNTQLRKTDQIGAQKNQMERTTVVVLHATNHPLYY